eukprot:TRINITY_DN24863_c0_g1_i1.p1 TRINITY_DN24863_c0_g1~~TRINITY_DN24863_c0_g1_i1.p1  ORF type:complete len:680 (-),score=151.94 TRINITY_DN24863_c0_g1_i1:5-2044(-)
MAAAECHRIPEVWPCKAPADVPLAAYLVLQSPEALQTPPTTAGSWRSSSRTRTPTPRCTALSPDPLPSPIYKDHAFKAWRRLAGPEGFLEGHTEEPQASHQQSASWAADNLMVFADKHRLGGVAPFPPPYSEEPPDRTFLAWRQALTSAERTREQESCQHVGKAAGNFDLSRLPRRQRIELLEGLVAPEVVQAEAQLPPERRKEELEPMRHFGAARARREFTARWGSKLHPRYLNRRGQRGDKSRQREEEEISRRAEEKRLARERDLDERVQEEFFPVQPQRVTPGLSLPSSATSRNSDQKAVQPQRVSPDLPTPSCATDLVSEPPHLLRRDQRVAEPDRTQLAEELQQQPKSPAAQSVTAASPRDRTLFARRRWAWDPEEEKDDLSSKDAASLLEELGRRAAKKDGETVLAEESVRMVALARALEVRAYKLSWEHLLKALVLVGRGTTGLEAAAQPVRGEPITAREPQRRAAEDMAASTQALAAVLSTEALSLNMQQVVEALKALCDSGAGCKKEYLDAQLARLQELFRRERKLATPLFTKLAGALGNLLLAGPGKASVSARDGASASSRARNMRFIDDFHAALMQKLPDFLEEDFLHMGWVFPTAYLSEGELRKLLTRAAELQVGLRPESDSEACLETMQHIVAFTRQKMPQLVATLSDLTKRYVGKLEYQGRLSEL